MCFFHEEIYLKDKSWPLSLKINVLVFCYDSVYHSLSFLSFFMLFIIFHVTTTADDLESKARATFSYNHSKMSKYSIEKYTIWTVKCDLPLKLNVLIEYQIIMSPEMWYVTTFAWELVFHGENH